MELGCGSECCDVSSLVDLISRYQKGEPCHPTRDFRDSLLIFYEDDMSSFFLSCLNVLCVEVTVIIVSSRKRAILLIEERSCSYNTQPNVIAPYCCLLSTDANVRGGEK